MLQYDCHTYTKVLVIGSIVGFWYTYLRKTCVTMRVEYVLKRKDSILGPFVKHNSEHICESYSMGKIILILTSFQFGISIPILEVEVTVCMFHNC